MAAPGPQRQFGAHAAAASASADHKSATWARAVPRGPAGSLDPLVTALARAVDRKATKQPPGRRPETAG